MFLFSDNQIKDESFVEDINMILNTGDVPNLYAADEKAEIIEKMQNAARVEVGRRQEQVMGSILGRDNLSQLSLVSKDSKAFISKMKMKISMPLDLLFLLFSYVLANQRACN